MATPIASVPGGGTRYSDGSVRYVSLPYAQSRPVVQSTPAPKTTTTKSSGGSSSGGVSQEQPAYSLPQAPSGPSQEDYNALIDQAYNEQMGYLSGVEARLKPDYESALAEAESAYKTQAAGLGLSLIHI